MAAMNELFGRVMNLFVGTEKLPKITPMKEMGVSGTAVFSGLPQVRERNAQLVGTQKWITYADLVTNISIVAAGTRYFLNVVANSTWSLEPADESAESKAVAEFIEDAINDMETPFRRVVRRSSMYRFHGFGIQEWTAKRRRQDKKIGLDDIESRPQHTIERWQVDDHGTVVGVWQRAPYGGDLLYLPRGKIVYLVEDSLTDAPDGQGLLRHLIEPFERLKRYMELEGRGFERDLRGIPIGRIPYAGIRSAVSKGLMTAEEARTTISAIESFVQIQSKQPDTSIILDSAPYINQTEGGNVFTGTMQYGIELLQGQSEAFADIGHAIDRCNREMARVLGVEGLLLGEGGGANRALSEDKSRNFYLVVNGTLDEIADAMSKDVVNAICDLNGIDEDRRPKLKHSDIALRSVQEVTAALANMASAGAVLSPNDPAVNDVRDLLGISQAPEMSPEQLGMMGLGPMPEDAAAAAGTEQSDEEAADNAEAGSPDGEEADEEEEDDDDEADKKKVKKFNEHHDEAGRFTTSGTAATGSSSKVVDAQSARDWVNSPKVGKVLSGIVKSPVAKAALAASVSGLVGSFFDFSDPIADDLIAEHVRNLGNHMMVSAGVASMVLRNAVEQLKRLHNPKMGTYRSKINKAGDKLTEALDAILDALDRFDAQEAKDNVTKFREELGKYNFKHDERGRFDFAEGGGGGSGGKADISRDLSQQASSRPTQRVNNLSELYNKSYEAEQNFYKMVERFAGSTRGTVHLPPEDKYTPGSRLKTLESSERKMRDELNGDPKQLLDVLRGTILYKNIEQSRNAVVRFIKDHPKAVVRIKDRHEKPAAGGYRDILLNVRMPNGVITELQFNSKNLMSAKSGEGHKLYERLRTYKGNSAAVKNYLNRKSEQLYDEAWKADGNGDYKKKK